MSILALVYLKRLEGNNSCNIASYRADSQGLLTILLICGCSCSIIFLGIAMNGFAD